MRQLFLESNDYHNPSRGTSRGFGRKTSLAQRARLRRRERHQNAKCSLLDLEVNRTIPGQFAVEFHRNILLACYAQATSLEIFNLMDSNVRTKHNVLQIFDDFEISEPFEDNYIN